MRVNNPLLGTFRLVSAIIIIILEQDVFQLKARVYQTLSWALVRFKNCISSLCFLSSTCLRSASRLSMSSASGDLVFRCEIDQAAEDIGFSKNRVGKESINQKEKGEGGASNVPHLAFSEATVASKSFFSD